MFDSLFATAGKFFASKISPSLGSIGSYAGKLIGKFIDHDANEPDEYWHYAKMLDNLYINSCAGGRTIPIVFGRAKVIGEVIWALPLREEEICDEESRYVSYQYYATFAMGICKGEIDGIERVWAGNNLIDLKDYEYNIYYGSEHQQPDEVCLEDSPNAPAYKGLAYIVFKDLPLKDFSNRLPIFSFEVINNSGYPNRLENKIKSLVMIPGCGEFVYDTKLQSKDYGDFQEYINKNNSADADALDSLNQTGKIFKNLEWISVVVAWFGTSLDLASCKILPAVEYQGNYNTTEEWRVAEYSRSSAYLIGRDKSNMSPRYGGTINDASLVRYLEEMKDRGYKIMLYPLFMIDLPDKPWRGHLTGKAIDVHNFFSKENGGYNKFIQHYANLTKGYIDAFSIGSELIGLTKIRDFNSNKFPAVEALVELAKKTKAILGNDIKVTYAADWSEYHHTEGGHYNLDLLWACKSIDFIGIDAYFPLTDTVYSNISEQEIKDGWCSGEGYQYYKDGKIKKALDAKYAWKNIQYWWENYHYDSLGNKTPWVPKSKKIWFTEFGFPSVDKAPNQPNVFFDPICMDSNFPKHSSAQTDFIIQRRAIRASLDFWQGSDFLENMFLWCYDARPTPAWPHHNIWKDSMLWEKGHWFKANCGMLSAIIEEICALCDIKDVDTSMLEERDIEGFIIESNMSGKDAIELLRLCYIFEISAKSDYISFFHSKKQEGDIYYSSLSSDVSIREGYKKLHKASLIYMDMEKELRKNYVLSSVDYEDTYQKNRSIKMPIVTYSSNAKMIANDMVNAQQEVIGSVIFNIPSSNNEIEIGKLYNLHLKNEVLVIRIAAINGMSIKTNIFGFIIHRC